MAPFAWSSRVAFPTDAYCLNHNNSMYCGKHFSVLQRIAFIFYTFAIGDQNRSALRGLLSRLLQREIGVGQVAVARSGGQGSEDGVLWNWAGTSVGGCEGADSSRGSTLPTADGDTRAAPPSRNHCSSRGIVAVFITERAGAGVETQSSRTRSGGSMMRQVLQSRQWKRRVERIGPIATGCRDHKQGLQPPVVESARMEGVRRS